MSVVAITTTPQAVEVWGTCARVDPAHVPVAEFAQACYQAWAKSGEEYFSPRVVDGPVPVYDGMCCAFPGVRVAAPGIETPSGAVIWPLTAPNIQEPVGFLVEFRRLSCHQLAKLVVASWDWGGSVYLHHPPSADWVPVYPESSPEEIAHGVLPLGVPAGASQDTRDALQALRLQLARDFLAELANVRARPDVWPGKTVWPPDAAKT